jgi:hypothetical protein
MSRYESPTPRAAFGFAALGMTVITFSLLVGVPAAFDGRDTYASMAVATRHIAPMPTEVVINPSVIEIVAVRETHPVAADAGGLPAKRTPQG